jgi:flagellar hook-associated protein 2
MSGGFNVGGLISGLDTNTIVQQLMQLERQPILRLQSRISELEKQKESVSELRTQLLSLRNSLFDFRLGLDFNLFNTESTDDSIVTADTSGPNPVNGNFAIDVLQLASATVANSSARLGSPINPAAAFAVSGIAATVENGQFTINGTQFNFDFTTATLTDVINTINGAAIGVTASYDAVADEVVIENTAPGDTSLINFGGTGDTSNFLEVIGVTNALQSTNGSGSTTLSSVNHLGAVNPLSNLNIVNFAGGAVTAGNFYINGVAIIVDPTTESIEDVITNINNSDANVTASFDPNTDSIRVVAEDLGSRTIRFQSGTSNFLDVTNLTAAIQTAGQDAQYTIDGGAIQFSNSNDVTTAVNDLTITLQSVGTASITVSNNLDTPIEKITEFIEGFNESVSKIEELVVQDGELENDYSIRSIQSFLINSVFTQIPGLSGTFESFLDIGISTGDAFDASAVFKIELDEDELRAALLENKDNVAELFANEAETGIADIIFTRLDEITDSFGFLNERSKSGGLIDDNIEGIENSISRMEERLVLREARLRRQFTAMEQFQASFQAQSASLASIGQGL